MDTTQSTQPPWETLTAREQEIALLLGRGDTNREIADALGVSIKTIDTHRGHLLKKLYCKNNAKLTLFLVREGKLTP
jgi:DNA-binding CsgD family transcriptional regulator